jgi:FkbM family methyltransferase
MRFPSIYAPTRLPYATARYLLRRPHEHDYAAFGLFPQSDGVFWDIGANAGMSAMSFRIYQRHARIFSFEPNPYHESDLRWTKRLVGNMEYRIWAAGDTPGLIEFFVPVYRNVPITTEASMSRRFVEESPSLRTQLGERMRSPDFRIERISVEVHRLDELELSPAFVKIDVQGAEQEVLAGMTRSLATGPPVLIEAPSAETSEFMAAFGYAPYAYDHEQRRLVPPAGFETNVMFVRGTPPT